MPKVKLTTQFIRKIAKEKNGARVNYFDTEVTGLVLEVRKNNSMTYYYRYTKDYKTHMQKIGSPDSLKVEEARRLVLKIKKGARENNLENIFKPKKIAPTLKEYYYNTHKAHIEKHLKRPKDYDQYFRCHILPALKKGVRH